MPGKEGTPAWLHVELHMTQDIQESTCKLAACVRHDKP